MTRRPPRPVPAKATWTLYTSENGKVPKDLGELMGGVIAALRTRSPHLLSADLPDVSKFEQRCILTPEEIESLAVLLEFLHTDGLGPESPWHHATQNVQGGPYTGLKELKVPNTTNNPRLIHVVTDGNKVIFISGFAKKKMKLDKTKKDLARDRRISLKERKLWP